MAFRSRIRSGVIALAWLVATLIVIIYAVKTYQKTTYTDFDVYYRTSGRLITGNWGNIYDYNIDGNTPFRYSPLTLFLFRPLAELPYAAARQVWFFLQCAWFAAAFAVLFRSLRLLKADAALLTSLAFLFVARYCIDALSIGQVTGLMFLGTNLALYGWLKRRPIVAGLGLFVPASMKLGAGMIYALFLTESGRFRLRAILTAAAATLVLGAGVILWSGSSAKEVWSDYVDVTLGDSKFMDASHYGSQSMKSALLRADKAGWIEPATAERAWLAIAAILFAGLFAFWGLRRPTTDRGRALFFALGIFMILWLKPETFKYSFPGLAIPFAFLLAGKRDAFETFAIVFCIVTLSLGGMDVIGSAAYFFLMKASIPLVATLLFGSAVIRRAWMESIPARLPGLPGQQRRAYVALER